MQTRGFVQSERLLPERKGAHELAAEQAAAPEGEDDTISAEEAGQWQIQLGSQREESRLLCHGQLHAPGQLFDAAVQYQVPRLRLAAQNELLAVPALWGQHCRGKSGK